MFRILSNIQDRDFCTNSERLLVFDYFAKSFIFDVWQDSEFASKASYGFVEKAPSQMFDKVLNSPLITSKNLYPLVIFAKLLAISVLNLISITVLCTVKSTWPYIQHIWLITKIIIVFPNHVFLWTMHYVTLKI